MRRTAFLALPLAIALTGACRPAPTTHWNSVSYQSRTLAVDDAAAWFQRLMLTGRELSPIRVDVSRDFAVLYFYRGDHGMLHFGEIANARLLRAVEVDQFDVQLEDIYGRPLYRYTARNEERAHAFIDAVTTLAAGAAPPPGRRMTPG